MKSVKDVVSAGTYDFCQRLFKIMNMANLSHSIESELLDCIASLRVSETVSTPLALILSQIFAIQDSTI